MIHFIGNIQSQYGRGKDKKKRKRRLINTLKGAGLGLAGGAGGLGLSILKNRKKPLPLRKELIIGGTALGVATLGGAALGNVLFDKKPKLRSPLERLKIYRETQNNKKHKSVAATIPLVTAGTIAGATRSKKLLGVIGNSHIASMNPMWGAYNAGMTGAAIGLNIDKEISKEKARYQKEGARSRVGKIINDTKIGVKSTAGILAANQAITQSVKSFAKRNGLPIKTKLLGALGAGVGGAIYGAAKGSAIGAGIGSGVGTIRGFKQKNKGKKK